MHDQVFEVVSLKKADEGWALEGRARLDISVGDVIAASGAVRQKVTVLRVMAHGKETTLLSKMMTGTLVVEGEVQTPLDALYASKRDDSEPSC